MMLATRWAWVAAMGLGTCFALLISTQQVNIGGKARDSS
jgi:hypothetical protein